MSERIVMRKYSIQGFKVSTAVALVLLLTAALFVVSMQYVYAQPTRDEPTYAFISLTPNPVGVGQRVHVRLFLSRFPPNATLYYHGFQYIITKPDGTTQIGGPFMSDPNGAYDFEFTPSMVGNYTVEFKYPGETFNMGTVIINRLPSQARATLTVQQEQVQPWPEVPLPTDYWTRPVSAEFREWWSITGNWLQGGYDAAGRMYADAAAFNPYTQAPRSPHVVWVKEAAMGGLIGGEYGSQNYYPGIQYDSLVTPPLVINGKLYYRLFSSLSGAAGRYRGFVCVDLRTGQELWRNTTGNIDLGQVYVSMGYNGQGGRAFLWDVSSTTWTVYDAWSGDARWYLTGALTGSDRWVLRGSNGDLYIYIDGGTTTSPWLLMWNSTKAWDAYGFFSGGSLRNDRPGSFNWTLGIQWNVTVPNVAPWGFSRPTRYALDPSSKVIVLAGTPPEAPNSGLQVMIGYDAITGQQLWVKNFTWQGTLNNRWAVGEGMLVQMNMDILRRSGIDLKTGEQLWLSDPTAAPWGMYTAYGRNAYGKCYSGAYDGYMRAFDLKTGKEVWEYYIGNSGLETPYGTWPVFNGPIIGDHVVFAGYSEHTPNTPLYRGAKTFALDADTGKELWSIDAWLSLRALADGYLVTVNAYDNRIYAIGKGPSATTVSAPKTAVPKGSAVLIEGSVLDESPGQAGTPCVAKESMSAWMEYLHMQKPCPAEVKGVPVKLMAMRADGTVIDIGTAVTNGYYGVFSYAWTPPSEGQYTVVATFEGDESYGSSSAATGLLVVPAVSASASPPVSPSGSPVPSASVSPSVAPPSGGTPGIDVFMVSAAIVVIAVIVVAVVVLKRKKAR